jgi:hypothetical protein
VTGWVFDPSVPGTHPFLARLNDNIDGHTMNRVFQQIVPQFGTGTRLTIDPTVLDPTDPMGLLPTFVVTGSVANELGGSDLWLARYGLSGILLQGEFWRFGSFNFGSDIAPEGNGRFVLAGSANPTGPLHALFAELDALLTLGQLFFFTGSGFDSGFAVAFATATFNVFTAGATTSTDFSPLVNPFLADFSAPPGSTDGFVAKATL